MKMKISAVSALLLLAGVMAPGVGAVKVASEQVETCGTALPVTDVMTGNGGSTFQVFQSANTGSHRQTYVSFSLATNNINNGADAFGFGIEFKDASTHYHVKSWNARGGTCLFVGYVEPDAEYFVEAGAGGWTSSSSCTIGVSWEVTVGLEYGIASGGASGSAEVSVGGSLECSDGTTFDSELLFDDRGRIGNCIPCIIQ